MAKKFHITGASEVHTQKDMGKLTTQAIAEGGEGMQVSDGYHTMDELYTHRIRLFISMCRGLGRVYKLAQEGKIDVDMEAVTPVWRSKLHADGSVFEGWFILGINKEAGKQITYHLPLSYWDELEDFVETLDKAPEWDGHTPNDVLERLKAL